jgi:hypothetical protein
MVRDYRPRRTYVYWTVIDGWSAHLEQRSGTEHPAIRGLNIRIIREEPDDQVSNGATNVSIVSDGRFSAPRNGVMMRPSDAQISGYFAAL